MKRKKIEVNAEEAFNRHQSIVEREKVRRQLFIQNVVDLTKMYDTQEYKAIVGESDKPTWNSYLGQVEVFYSRAQVDRWRVIVKNLLEDLGFNLQELLDIPETRLVQIARLSLPKPLAEEFLHKARVLTPLDFNDEIALVLGKPSSYDCPHTKDQNYFRIFKICKKCGLKHKIGVQEDEREDEEIQQAIREDKTEDIEA